MEKDKHLKDYWDFFNVKLISVEEKKNCENLKDSSKGGLLCS